MNHGSMELVAPAGNREKMEYAFRYGADAVYMGAKAFSLREGAENFGTSELQSAVEFAHSLGKRVYLAMNIYFHNNHLPQLREFLRQIADIPTDGYIVSDLGVAAYIRETYPEKRIHISTQANTCNTLTAQFYEKMGVSRVILARELSLIEIAQMSAETSVELESFVHGAMCIAYSGRCLLSNYFTNRSVYREDEKLGNRKEWKTRDANLGDCSQSCRWKYQLVEESREGEYLPIVEEEHGTTILSSKDLNLSNNLKQLSDAGIGSFKIEGRMKSVYYVANVVRVYRAAIDSIRAGRPLESWIFDELNKISHRQYTTGFYFDTNVFAENESPLAPTRGSAYVRDYKFLATVEETLGGNRYRMRAMNQILRSNELEAIGPAPSNQLIAGFRLVKNGVETEKVQPNDEFVLECEADLKKMDILRKREE